MSARPWPWEPIARVLERQGLESDCEVARILGCSRSTVARSIERGLTDAQADAWSVALGSHPAELYGWDAWLNAGITERDDRHVNGDGLGWRQAWEWAEAQRTDADVLGEAA